ncbi:histidine phosphatase family protein [Paenibacillus sp. RC67]|uniref:histidine phosphatase family protein n=1 Tax=Paenibacillus sp. RC67 TaxID=3039392 RepID=UPI0024AE405C|nr:histidine phosphatase family protein [Paenibacillus sp. RC67]
MITLGFIRHGTTEWNIAGRMQGQMDTALAEVGVKQAQLLAERLKGETWDAIVTSDLVRAQQTAETIAHVTGTPLIGSDIRLRERSFGQVEGTTLEERISRWGEGWREADVGMEADEALLKRWHTFMEELQAKHAGKRILIVSHGGYIAPVVERMLGRRIEEHLNNTSLTIIEGDPTGWNCKLLNCTIHLNT